MVIGVCVHPGGNGQHAFPSYVRHLLQCVTAVINTRFLLSVRSVQHAERGWQ